MAQGGTAPDGVDGTVRSVSRAVKLLSLFSSEHPDRTLNEIVQLTGLPKTTVVRLLGTVESLGLVAQRSPGTYSVGPVFLRWVMLANSVWEVGHDARVILSSLVDECGETANIYIRRDWSRVSIAQVEGTTTVRSVVEVGAPYPLSSGAAGLILLDDAPSKILKRMAAADHRLTLDELQQEVRSVKEQGFAVSHGQRELGASAVAAPILAQDGRVLAALSVSGPTSRFTQERVDSYIAAVTRAAKEISEVGLGAVEAFL